MAQEPYAEADALDLMRADADQVELVAVPSSVEPQAQPAGNESAGLAVPSDAVDLGGALHFHLD